MADKEVSVNLNVDVDGIIQQFKGYKFNFKNLKAATNQAASSMEKLGVQMSKNVFLEELALCIRKTYPETIIESYYYVPTDTYKYMFKIIAPSFHKAPPLKWMYECTAEGMLQSSVNMFVGILKELCKGIDNHFHMVYALMPSPKQLSYESNVIDFNEVGFNQTTSYFEYLQNTGAFKKSMIRIQNAYDEPPTWPNKFGVEFNTGGVIKASTLATGYIGQSYSDSGRRLAEVCPGAATLVKNPCACYKSSDLKATVFSVIMHLNDSDNHGGVEQPWTREEIADWLESLDVDLSLGHNDKELEKEEQ